MEIHYLTAKDLKKCRIDSKTDESAEDVGNMYRDWKKIFSHRWLSSVIRKDAFIWGDQSKDGKSKSFLKIKGERALMSLNLNFL